MKFLFKGLVLVSVAGLVLADNYSGDCKEIYDYLKQSNYELNLKNCTTNEEGLVKQLDLYTYCLTEEDINQLIHYESISSLNLDTETTYYSNEYDTLKNCNQLLNLPDVITSLSNLESLELHSLIKIKEKDLLKIPSSVRKLTFGDVALEQFVIDDISQLSNIEELSFVRTTSNNELNFEPIKNLSNLSSLYISNSEDRRTVKKYINPSYLKSFTNLKKFEAFEYSFSQEAIDAISTLTNLEEITFTECGFDEDLDTESIGNLTNLKAFNMLGTTQHCLEEIDIFGGNNCPLDEIPESLFTIEGLKKLVYNKQKELDYSALEDIGELKKLEYLDLSGIQLNEVPSSIKQLKKLQYLNLSNNFIETVPDIFSKIKNIEEIDLSSNSLKTLPASFGKLKNLKKLNLGLNEFESIPEVLGNLKNVEYLNMEFNKLTNLSKSLGNMKNLKELDLNTNGLTIIPDDSSIVNLSNLEVLKIESNFITSLPKDFGNLKNLKNLDLYYNKIESLPESFENLINLNTINLAGNNLVTLPESIGNLENLKSLVIEKNNLVSLPETLGGMKSLVNLDLSYNDLIVIPESIGDLVNLETLNLSTNNIEAIPESLANLQNLKIIYLNYNNISKFPRALGEIKSINIIDLAYNVIDDEIPKSLNDLPVLNSVNFGNNVNLTGETLTNDSLDQCYYGKSYGGYDYNLCAPKIVKCFSTYASFKPCDNIEVTETVVPTSVAEEIVPTTVLFEEDVASTTIAVEEALPTVV